jgi:acetyl esterase
MPATEGDALPPVHVNFHGGGYVMPLTEMDDAFCRYLAEEAGVVVINVDYVLAPQHRFPAPPRQAFEVVRWVAAQGAEHGWDGSRLSVGGQSAGGGLAAAVARQALEEGGPSIALQVLHYPPLDLATGARDKRAAIAKPSLRPWMADVFDSAYVPDPKQRADRLVSPGNPADTANVTGIAPALVITAEYDLLKAEGTRYAERLRKAGALVEHHDVLGADHGYDVKDAEKARQTYALIARHVRQALAT